MQAHHRRRRAFLTLVILAHEDLIIAAVVLSPGNYSIAVFIHGHLGGFGKMSIRADVVGEAGGMDPGFH